MEITEYNFQFVESLKHSYEIFKTLETLLITVHFLKIYYNAKCTEHMNFHDSFPNVVNYAEFSYMFQSMLNYICFFLKYDLATFSEYI